MRILNRTSLATIAAAVLLTACGDAGPTIPTVNFSTLRVSRLIDDPIDPSMCIGNRCRLTFRFRVVGSDGVGVYPVPVAIKVSNGEAPLTATSGSGGWGSFAWDVTLTRAESTVEVCVKGNPRGCIDAAVYARY